MRVSQIQNLTWLGNVLVLGGLVWVGIQFWNVNKLTKQKPKEPEWAKAKSSDDVGKQRWPGELAAFKHIWETHVNGKVPPPPPPVVKEQPKVDRITEFKNKVKYLNGMEFIAEPERSYARINFDGKEVWVSPGHSLGEFQLTQFTLDNRDPEPKKRTFRLVFLSPDGQKVVIEDVQPNPASVTDGAPGPFQKALKEPIGVVVKPDACEQKAWQDEKGDWHIPEDEQRWLEVYGEERVWKKLEARTEVGPDGKPKGLRILSFPETGTPLARTHGIGQGDVVTAINGVAVSSKEEILNYLRGDGRGLTKYVVDVENNGAKRQVVYLVRRVEKPASRN
jgi:hypothetical protein